MCSGLGFKMTTPSSTDDSAMYFEVASSARSPALSSTGVSCVWKPVIVFGRPACKQASVSQLLHP